MLLGTKEMMQPYLLHLHLISLVALRQVCEDHRPRECLPQRAQRRGETQSHVSFSFNKTPRLVWPQLMLVLVLVLVLLVLLVLLLLVRPQVMFL